MALPLSPFIYLHLFVSFPEYRTNNKSGAYVEDAANIITVGRDSIIASACKRNPDDGADPHSSDTF